MKNLVIKLSLVLGLVLCAIPSHAEIPLTLSISPYGVALKVGSTQQFTATCTYAVAATDDCTTAGGATWSLADTRVGTISSTGLLTWTIDAGVGSAYGSYVVVKAGGLHDTASVLAQHVGDTFTIYITPAYTTTTTSMPVVVGATVALGAGIEINRSDNLVTGSPFQEQCNWSTSDATKATVTKHGLVTAVAPGTVTITCNRVGDAAYLDSTVGGWDAPGNFVVLNIVNGGTSNQTWYVRSDGGSYYDATTSPSGLCDGKSDLAAAGAASHHCAVDNLRDLWADGVTQYQEKWVILGGDTVYVEPTASGVGYNMNLDSPSPYQNTNAGASFVPINCNTDVNCNMPSIPSGTSARHTKILGSNYSNCHSDSAKTLLNVSFAGNAAFNTVQSQFVDIACFEISDKVACDKGDTFTNYCGDGFGNGINFGKYGIVQSALTSETNYTDLFIHGLSRGGIFGASGSSSVVADYVHIRANGGSGINMDDAVWGTSNISVAGGFTLKNSITEWTACVEEYPVVHNYPVIECKGQSLAPTIVGDGFATASADGDWIFDHDIWRYNMQDGLDLLHAGMQSISVTNSQSYAEDGQTFKIGNADNVIFRSNLAINNCSRIGQVIGDEPSSAVPTGETLCRAAGDGVLVKFADIGNYYFQANTEIGYSATAFDILCGNGWYDCSHANTIFQDNIAIGQSLSGYNEGQAAGLFNTDGANFIVPANGGWATRNHNIYYGFKAGCPTPLGTGELCSDPLLVSEPPTSITSETQMDNFNPHLTTGSPAKFTGIAISGLTTDQASNSYASAPSMGAYEFMTAAASSVAIAITPSTFAVDGHATVSCTATLTDSTTRPCLSPVYTNNSTSLATLSGADLLGVSVGTGTISVTAEGFTSGNMSFTVTAKPVLVFFGGSPLIGGSLR